MLYFLFVEVSDTSCFPNFFHRLIANQLRLARTKLEALQWRNKIKATESEEVVRAITRLRRWLLTTAKGSTDISV